MQIVYLADHPEFVQELAELHFAEWGELEPEQTVEVRARDFRAYRGRSGFPTAFVAHQGGVLVGSVLLVADDLEVRPQLTPWLAGVLVKPEYRKQGVASTLIEAALAEAARQELPRLYLYTEHNESLYVRFGFRLLERCAFRGRELAIMLREARRTQPELTA